jgi:O-antigen/teichoic acid export membrane protein
MRRSFLRGLLLNAGGSGTVAGVALLRNVLIAQVMGPAAFGLWQVCLVALRLAGEVHLGALHALALDGPIHRGAGREEAARLLEKRCLGAATLFAALGGLAAAAVLRLEGGPALGAASALLALAVFLQQVFQSHGALLSARRQFGRLAVLQVTFAVVHLAGLLLLLPGRYITGVLVAWCAGALLSVVLVRTVTGDPIPFPVPPSPADAAAAVRRGFPTYLVGAAFVLLLQVDRMVVGVSLGREALGRYGILVLGGSALLFVPGVIAGVLWPYAGEHYGRSGGSREALRPLARSTLRALALALAAALVLVSQGTEVLVAKTLTNYRPALDALRLYLPGVFFLGLVHPLRLFLVTAGGDRALLRLFAWMLVLTAAAEGIAAASGAGIGGVALAGTAAAALLFCLALRLAREFLAMGPDSFRTGLECAGLLAAALLGDLLLDRLGPPVETVTGAVVRLALPALALLAAGAAVLRIRDRLPRESAADAGSQAEAG